MKKFFLLIALLAVLGFSTQAQAGVSVVFGVGGPGAYYGPGYYGYYPGYVGAYFGPGNYPWYHGYWPGGYYRAGYYGHGAYYGGGYRGGAYSHH